MYIKTVILGCILFISSTSNTFDSCSKKIHKKELSKYFSEDQLTLSKFIKAIIKHESKNNTTAFNEKELAVGILQIRPIMVREINILVGYQKYSMSDRWHKRKSIEMFIDFQLIRNPEMSFEKAARMWNGGANGHNKQSTEAYWNIVNTYFNNGSTPSIQNFSTLEIDRDLIDHIGSRQNYISMVKNN